MIPPYQRFTTKIRAINMTLLGGRPSSDVQTTSESSSMESNQRSESLNLPDETDDLPF